MTKLARGAPTCVSSAAHKADRAPMAGDRSQGDPAVGPGRPRFGQPHTGVPSDVSFLLQIPPRTEDFLKSSDGSRCSSSPGGDIRKMARPVVYHNKKCRVAMH